ncbi:MAG TPA: AbrB/MazE/SpoVT family DNA-binding domain-containing protein [Spirochaetota bacterium]|nr:AbrB/MazE/SpoVT family DNA-binding domain-containing protein [Spirochaetota bacterium]
MEIVVKKWGSSLGIVIPKIIAKDLNLKDGSPLEIKDINGNIIVSPKKYSLSEMISKISDSNIHNEVEFGNPSGREIW